MGSWSTEKRELWKSPLLRAVLGCERALEERAGWKVQCWAGAARTESPNSCSWAVLASADLNKTLQVPGAGACSGFDVLTKLGYVT